jgi:diguanylate cyclase
MRSERHAKTLPYAKFAIAQIERFELPADPYGFELWYTYATGQNPALTKAIDEALSSPTGMTEQIFDGLCDLYLGSKRTGPRLRAAASDLSGEINQIMGMIGAAAEPTRSAWAMDSMSLRTQMRMMH